MFKKILKSLNILGDVRTHLESMDKLLQELNSSVKEINQKIANLSERVSKLEGIVETQVKLNDKK